MGEASYSGVRVEACYGKAGDGGVPLSLGQRGLEEVSKEMVGIKDRRYGDELIVNVWEYCAT